MNDKLIELVRLADKIIELVDVPVPVSEEEKRKRWFESGLAISAYREARSKLPSVLPEPNKSEFWERVREASQSMQLVLEGKLPR